MKITIIYLKEGMLLSKKKYDSWRNIQEEFDDYKASLGPWDSQEVIEYLNEEYEDLSPDSNAQVGNLLKSESEIEIVTFS